MATKKGFHADGTLDKSQTFTNGNTGVTTYGDGSPAPNLNERQAIALQNQQSQNQQINDGWWAPYGGAPGGATWGNNGKATTGYTDKGDGSDAWKYSGYQTPYGMKNPVMVGHLYYDRPLAKAPTTTPGGAPLPIPSVQERMTRMGQAVQKGIDTGSIGANQMQDKFKYQVPGSSPTTPVTNPVASPKTNTLVGMTRLT